MTIKNYTQQDNSNCDPVTNTTGSSSPTTVDASRILALAKRRGILWPSFEIYGGLAGFYDYGPLGTVLKQNVINLWRKYYVIGEGYAEIDASTIAIDTVFKASGHVDEFADLMVECLQCHEAYKVDTVLSGIADFEAISQDLEELRRLFQKVDIRCQACGGTLSEPEAFNLMFRTTVGPGSIRTAYLRPETAQAMFINFPLLYRYFREKLPFGVVQIGRAYRNEIAPRQAVIRLREFNQAEAEVFVDPEDKAAHPKFDAVKNIILNFLPATDTEGSDSTTTTTTIEAAVKRYRYIQHEWLAYHIGLTAKFLIELGLDPDKLRFRQHHKREMAHYATDCWDAEALTSFGWIELVGIADRACYDLEAHARHAKVDMSIKLAVPEKKPHEKVSRKIVKPNFKVLGPRYKHDARKIAEQLRALTAENVKGKSRVVLDINGRKVEVAEDCYYVEKVVEEVACAPRRFIPHVIEPSYGLDRIIYALLEHSYYEKTSKELGTYTVLRLPPSIAPINVGVFPLMPKDRLDNLAQSVDAELRRAELYTYYDERGSIGRRYARMDEVGTPFCVTVDYESLANHDVTLRERDTTEQVRIEIDNLPEIVIKLIKGSVKFDDLKRSASPACK